MRYVYIMLASLMIVSCKKTEAAGVTKDSQASIDSMKIEMAKQKAIDSMKLEMAKQEAVTPQKKGGGC